MANASVAPVFKAKGENVLAFRALAQVLELDAQ